MQVFMRKKPIIAIDGPAASGKGTLARKIAEKMNYAHMDTGALYRAVAYLVTSNGKDASDAKAALEAAQYLRTHFDPKFLAKEELRTDIVGQAASKVAAMPNVRIELFNMQHDFAHNPPEPYQGAVLDGRDIGTVICPDATIKLFVTASMEVRAERRLKELQSAGIDVTYTHVLTDMRERDERDTGRKDAPLMPASDAHIIDTSDLSAADALKKALAIVNA